MSYDLVDEDMVIVAGETYTRGYDLTPDDPTAPCINPAGMVATAMFRATRDAAIADLTLTSPSGGLVFVEGDATTPTALYLTASSAQTLALLAAWTRRAGWMDIRLTEASGSVRYLVERHVSLQQPVTRP